MDRVSYYNKEGQVMKEQTIIFDVMVPKKHSIRYDTTDKNSAVSSIYIKRSVLGDEGIPEKVKIVITEA